jgi:hypothetical protein
VKFREALANIESRFREGKRILLPRETWQAIDDELIKRKARMIALESQVRKLKKELLSYEARDW